MEKRPCFDCRHFDTFESHEEEGSTCKIGRAATHLNCEFRESYPIEAGDSSLQEE